MTTLGWTADSTVVTADSTEYTADGAYLGNDLATPYTSLITSEHNQKPMFMAMVGAVTGAVAAVTAGIQSIQPAFDLNQAVGKQLDVLGQWIGQERTVENVLVLGFFGFADDPAALGFGERTDISVGGIWYNLGETFTGSTVLNDGDYLTILKARIVKNQSNGTPNDIENALNYIFDVPCTLVDNGTLNVTINISEPITSTAEALLSGLDILPRPAGVAFTVNYAS